MQTQKIYFKRARNSAEARQLPSHDRIGVGEGVGLRFFHNRGKFRVLLTATTMRQQDDGTFVEEDKHAGAIDVLSIDPDMLASTIRELQHEQLRAARETAPPRKGERVTHRPVVTPEMVRAVAPKPHAKAVTPDEKVAVLADDIVRELVPPAEPLRLGAYFRAMRQMKKALQELNEGLDQL